MEWGDGGTGGTFLEACTSIIVDRPDLGGESGLWDDLLVTFQTKRNRYSDAKASLKDQSSESLFQL